MSGEEKRNRSHSFDPQYIVTLVLAAVIFIVNFRTVNKCYNPFLFNDEMGYWMHAAEFAGLDWTGVSETVIWYSYGYSFLLTPLIKFISDTVILYRAALLLNVIMDVTCYFMFIYIIRRLFPKLEILPASAVAATGILYASYQMNAGIAWSETALLTATTIVILLMVRAMQKPSYLNLACLGAFSVYAYMVHNRTIGVAASVVLFVAAAVICRKVTLKQAAVFAAAITAGFISDRLIKAHLVSIFWRNGPSDNDASSMFEKLKYALTSAEGFKRLMGVFAGQAFAISVSTFCLLLFSFVCIARRGAIVLHKKKKSGKKLTEDVSGRHLVFMFIVCAFISTYIISSVFLINFNRIDHVIYTRYMDIFSGIFIMMGICFALEAEKEDLIASAFGLGIMVLLALAAKKAVGSMTVFIQFCSPNLVRLFYSYGTSFLDYLRLSAFTLIVILFIPFVLKKRKICVYLCAAVCIFVFCINTPCLKEEIFNYQFLYKGDRALCDRVKELPEKQIYILPDSGNYISFLQFEMKDVRVELVESPETVSKDGYLFVPSHKKDDFMKYEKIDHSNRYNVYLIKASE